ncbi:MAG TPA: 1,4-alpha-glucan branching protein GlgB [Phycisphaerales bacterium]|nr:1,4-alpha-glucan branching protein GlgB [Phycisphaerales bacterium]
MTRTQTRIITEDDLYLFNEGTHAHLGEKLGAQPAEVEGRRGAHFAVWAPGARSVHVVGDFNAWDALATPLSPRGASGIWEGFVAGVDAGANYKYFVRSGVQGHEAQKADPVAIHAETPPYSASKVWFPAHEWRDAPWMEARRRDDWRRRPVSIYELHLGSWRRVPEEGNRPLSYREAAEQLAEYVGWLGFTHVELLPVMEHPFDGSWGYQTTGYFAPTSRFGSPDDFMEFVDTLHGAGIGVILDWVPSHFATDGHGLIAFDGTHLYEHEDPRQGFHPDWGSFIFNYGRHEVRSFLLSSANHWIERFHADGVRVDAVASMLYLDYSRKQGEWVPNRFGGKENVEAIEFLRRLNTTLYGLHPDIMTIAEESTAFAGVSRPVEGGGLGFGFKWDMGWMNDTLRYFQRDPAHRRWHHDELTFRGLYAFTESYVLPLSHDEVVHGKGSLLAKMPGDDWQKFANLRLLLAYQWLLPGKKLLFMGGEFGQREEWRHDRSLDWHLTHYREHAGMQELVRTLNRLYREHPALHQADCEEQGFEWVHCDDRDNSVLAFFRHAADGSPPVLCAFNFTPVPRDNYRLGVAQGSRWRKLFDSDSEDFGGSGYAWQQRVHADAAPMHGRARSVAVTLPPLGAVAFVAEG